MGFPRTIALVLSCCKQTLVSSYSRSKCPPLLHSSHQVYLRVKRLHRIALSCVVPLLAISAEGTPRAVKIRHSSTDNN